MRLALVSISALALLSGCTTASTFVDRILPDRGSASDFTNTNYTAADELAKQLQGNLPATVPITPARLTMIPSSTTENVAPDAPFPGLVIQQVSSRLVQRGYKIASSEQAMPPANRNDFGRVVLLGDYLISNREIVTHLEIQDEKNGRILAAHDYAQPLTTEVQNYLKSGSVDQRGMTKKPVMQPSQKTTSASPPPVPLTGVQSQPLLPPAKAQQPAKLQSKPIY